MSSLRSIRALLWAPTSHARVSRQFPSPKATQAYHTSLSLRLPYKDDQDRESLKPRSQEGTKSNLDDDSAAHTDTAFDPSKTGPEEQKKSAKEETGDDVSPLEVSGASPDKSAPLGSEGGEEMKSTTKGEKSKKSGAGEQKKQGKGPGSS